MSAFDYGSEELPEIQERSVDWLRENYAHIWWSPALNRDQKAGFLAACCDSRRCYLATLSLADRVKAIGKALK